MKTPKSLYSRLALITSVTLVIGYFVVYAAWSSLTIEEVGSGATITTGLMNKIRDNFEDLNTRVSNFGFNAGNVGIGTESPNQKLHTVGALGVPATSGSSQNGVFRIGTSNNIVLDMGIKLQGSDTNHGSWIQSTDKSNHAVNYFLLLNPNGGNVGIGTTNPTQKLDVAGRITTSTAYGNGMGWSHMINAGQNMSFLVRNGGLYRLTIKASQSSVAAYIGQYLVYGLNKGAGSNPVVVTAGQSAATDWTFSYTLNGTYDANMIITAGTWTNQGLYIIVEKLYDY